ncbi:MAG TPA: SulP family inorganic anion transporter [Piscirickettsiaceae bacterium]|nr:SulP family inorganic anion transporter [Piscirickettsiaceae bacterium]
MFSLINKHVPSNAKNDFLSGLTVALALVPEAVAFALVAHVHPLVGLYAAFMVGMITSVLGGRPGMISGATGALAVVMVALVVEHGVQYLFGAVVLMGFLQISFGLFKLGKFIRLVPHPVFLGFVNGLAMVIFLAQLEHFKTAEGWVSNGALLVMGGLILLTMAIIHFLPKLTTAIPSTLVAIVTGSVLAIVLNLDTKTVGDMASISGNLPDFAIPNIPFTLETLYIILPYSIILALIGLIESLLTLNLVDELTETTGKPNKECIGQGVANTVTGFFGGMGGCAMVGQSIINIKSGGRGRLSGFVAGSFLLSFILLFSQYIEQIPIAVLVGVMFIVVIGTFEWCSFKLISRVPLADSIVGISVAVITVFTDLAIAVIVGVLMSAIVFSWNHAKQIYTETSIDEKSGIKTYKLNGPLFFASAQNFQGLFDLSQDPNEVYVDFNNSKVMDHSAIKAIDKLAERYQKAGKILHLIHLTAECKLLLKTARGLVEVNVLEDPTYHVADDKLA